ncbi:MAG: hypothetical protein K8R44_04585 [Sulfurimonas sp.]|nr:hypothetical protein [Sulfurimonas sp.]
MLEIIKDLQADLNELNKQPSANAEAIERLKNKIHELKRSNIIGALVEQGCDKNWCEQFKTEDLQNMLNQVLFADKETLTEAIVLEAIEPHKFEWITDSDWWFGSSTSFKNAIYGYDVNVCHSEETNKIEAIIYALKPSKEDKGHLEISEDTLFKFEIEIELTNWNKGQLVTPIAIE